MIGIIIGILLFSPDVQIFVDTGEERGYGDRWEYVIRINNSLIIRAAEPCTNENPGGWGEQVKRITQVKEIYRENYENGNLVSSLGPCYGWWADLPILSCPDWDADGDVDLWDFAEFQNNFTGPKE